MTTRTVKMFGLAYGSSPAEITVTLDGATIYTGTVTTTDAPVPSMPDPDLVNSLVEFCNFEIPMDFEGTKPMTCTVTSGTVIFASIAANYIKLESEPGIFNSSGPNNFYSLAGVRSLALADVRSEVTIDGVEQPMHPPGSNLIGTWYWTIDVGSVLAYNLNAVAGLENPPTTP